MIKTANASVRAEWPLLVDLGECGAEQTRFHRPAPAEPLAFYAGHLHGAKVYTNGADRDTIVAPKFKQTMFALLVGVQALNLSASRGTMPKPSASPSSSRCASTCEASSSSTIASVHAASAL